MTQQDAARKLASVAVEAAIALRTIGAKKLAKKLSEAVRVFDKHEKYD